MTIRDRAAAARFVRATALAVAATLIGGLGLISCTGEGSEAATLDSAGSATPGQLTLVTSFYPLDWVASEVGGDAVFVSDLTPPGGEPHDLELTPSAVAEVGRADLVVYLSGFQPAVDAAVRHARPGAVLDVAAAARADLTYGDESDPHFWLDPTRLAAVATAVADRLAAADPAHAAEYTARLASVQQTLDELDRGFAAGLATCTSRDLVTSHPAFGYLAARYDLTQIGITGRDPESEPSPRQLADVIDYVRARHLQTVYSEPLVSSTIARTVADDTGATVASLDPIESLSSLSAGTDYVSVMRANLDALIQGQGCA